MSEKQDKSLSSIIWNYNAGAVPRFPETPEDVRDYLERLLVARGQLHNSLLDKRAEQARIAGEVAQLEKSLAYIQGELSRMLLGATPCTCG